MRSIVVYLVLKTTRNTIPCNLIFCKDLAGRNKREFKWTDF